MDHTDLSDSNVSLKADGLDAALIGTAIRDSEEIFVYSVSKVLNILEQSMSQEDARDYYESNIASAYVGAETPIFVEDLPD